MQALCKSDLDLFICRPRNVFNREGNNGGFIIKSVNSNDNFLKEEST